MISYISGILVSKSPVRVVLDCNNIGYDLRIPISTYEKLPALNKEVKLEIHMVVSDDDIRLYAFHTWQEKELFVLLTTVNGIGPKIALSILSAMSWQAFVKNVCSENVDSLTIVPGLGKKTAQRLILELKDKIASSDLASSTDDVDDQKMKLINEAEAALVTLGYKLPDVRKTLKKMVTEENIDSSELLIKAAIRHIYRGKK